jgi:PBSX family phage terminase large subunit
VTATFAIVQDPVGTTAGFCPRGGARELWRHRGHECVLSGPAETGKTFSCLHKLDALLWRFPRSQAVIVRKTLASLHTSAMRTYRTVLGPGTPVTFYGGEKPEWADYPNGSRVHFAGMDNPQKALSSERDFIYVNQVEELGPDDWEVLTTRATGRAANAPYAQVFGDCNPGPPTHWILHRPSLRLFESRHEDNPTLFDDDGRITERGRRTLDVLDRLTGARKERLRYGRWVQAEGIVYEDFDPARNLIDRFPIPPDWRRIRAVDFGFTNPFACLGVAIDHDGRMFVHRELYRTQRTVADHAAEIRRLWGDEPVEATVADHDAEDRATLHAAGIWTVPAYKAISPGLQAVAERLRPAGDGKPRLFLFRDALIDRDESLAARGKPCCTAEEFPRYAWPKGQDGRPVKETPLDIENHGMDCVRYACAYVDGLGYGPVRAGADPLAGWRG